MSTKKIFNTKEGSSRFHEMIIKNEGGYYEAKYLYRKPAFDCVSPKSITTAFKKPENAPIDVLIAFSEYLFVEPYELIKKYSLGKDKIGGIVIDYFRKEYQQNKSEKKTVSAA